MRYFLELTASVLRGLQSRGVSEHEKVIATLYKYPVCSVSSLNIIKTLGI
jgi:hypothetical protein